MLFLLDVGGSISMRVVLEEEGAAGESGFTLGESTSGGGRDDDLLGGKDRLGAGPIFLVYYHE